MKKFILFLLLFPMMAVGQQAEVVDEGIVVYNGATKRGTEEITKKVETKWGTVTFQYKPTNNYSDNCCPDSIVVWDLPDNIIANPREYELEEGEELLIKLDEYVGF